MSYAVPVGEVVHFDVITSHPTTGAASDADSTPTFEVYEESTDTPMIDTGSPWTGSSMTKRTGLTGNYRGSFTASGANGFEAGKFYSVIVSATVNAVAAKCVAMHFRCVHAEYAAGIPVVDPFAVDWNTTESPGNVVVKTPDGVTTMHTKTLTTDAAAEPVTGAS